MSSYGGNQDYNFSESDLQNSKSISESMQESSVTIFSSSEKKEEPKEMNRLLITVGDRKYTATFYDNNTTIAFKERMPLSLNMSEMNGNEKYYYFSDSLPANSDRVGSITSGDIMLFGTDCLVLFYEDFTTSYSYTRIAKLDNPSALSNAVGRGSTEISFELTE